MDILVVFLLGLTSGFHCLFMCGNVVFGYFLKTDNKTVKANSVFLYNSGRLISYAFVGASLGLLGKTINLTAIQPYALLFTSIILILIAIRQADIGFFKKTSAQSILDKAYQKLFTRYFSYGKSKKPGAPLLLGLLTGFMPCTPLQAAQVYAITSANPLKGSLIMLSFGLGNLPFLLISGFIATKASSFLKAKLKYAIAAIMLILGIGMLNRALLSFGSNLTLSTGLKYFSEKIKNSGDPEDVKYKDAYILKIENVSYIPSTLVVPAGKKIRIVVERNESIPCSNELLIPELKVRKTLKPFGKTVLELPPLKPGIYRLTCQMFMMEGYIYAK